jgi:hypothetical protein
MEGSMIGVISQTEQVGELKQIDARFGECVNGARKLADRLHVLADRIVGSEPENASSSEDKQAPRPVMSVTQEMTATVKAMETAMQSCWRHLERLENL